MKPNQPQEREPLLSSIFEGLVEAAPDAMITVDGQGVIRLVNRQAEILFGYPRKELIGRPLETLVPERFADVHPGHRARYFSEPRTRPMGVGLVLAGRRKDGTEFPVDIALSFIETEEGVLATAAVRDVTERERADEALRARQEETRQILETAQDAYIGMDATGQITDWNRQAEVIFGWNRDEAIGRTLADTIIPYRFREAHWKGLRKFLETGEGPVLNRRLELAALRRDGTEFPVELTIWPLRAGETVRFNALIHDIAERVGSRAQLNRQRKELAALHETTLDLIRRLEPSSLLGAILSRAAALLGTEHGYLYVVDEEAGELVVRAGIGMFAEYLGYRLPRGDGLAGRVWDTGEPLAVEDYRTWNGRMPEFSMIRAAAAIPLRAASEIVGVMGLVHLEEGPSFGGDQMDLLGRFARLASIALDNARLYTAAQDELRERRRAEKELERAADELKRANEDLRAADEVKDHIVAVTSHELKTPLTSVLGFATTLLRKWERLTDEQKREQIGMIEEQSRRLSRLVDELLTLSKIQAGALEVHPQAVEVAAAVGSVASSFAEDGAGIEVAVPGGQRVLADPDLFHQILTNYVANALRYGRAPIRIDSRDVDGAVEIVVRDGGDGVPEEFVPRLFERFAQAETVEGGTGLGLSIVRGLARASGGDVWYQKGVPTGACFGVRLPAA